MGPLTPPASGPIYVETNDFIYTVERVDPYRPVLDPFWQEVRATGAQTVTSNCGRPGRNSDGQPTKPWERMPACVRC